MILKIWYNSECFHRDWAFIPHLDELIKLEGKYYRVVCVSHKIDEGYISIITSQLEGEPQSLATTANVFEVTESVTKETKNDG